MKWAVLQLRHRERRREGGMSCGLSRTTVLWGGVSGLTMQKQHKPLWFPFLVTMAAGVPHWNMSPNTPKPCFPVAVKLRTLQYCKVVVTDVEMPVWEKV